MTRALLLLLLAIGCQSASAVEPPQEHETAVRLHMREHYDLDRAIERLLVRGQLEQARDLSRVMGGASDDLGFGTATRHVVLVRERAAALAASPGIDEACRRAAKLAAACATCHVDARIAPLFDATQKVPADEPTIHARMARHAWAVDRIWEGMVGNSDAAWRAGLDVIARPPLPWSELSGPRVALGRRLQDLAVRARQLHMIDDIDERARMYGEILVTCAACHAITEPEPMP